MPETPNYHLADVPHDLRARVLDRCVHRLYHEGLELLRENGIYHYDRDDLINFYNWAPDTLPSADRNSVEPPQGPRDYDQPPPEQIEDIHKRLAELPSEFVERLHHALKHESIEHVGNLLWKEGAIGFSSGDLYDYRKTLFPPNAMLDPYTGGPPVLRSESPPATPSAEPTTPPPVEPLPVQGQTSIAEEQPSLNAAQVAADPSIHSSTDPDLPSPAEAPPPVFKRRGKISGLPKAIREKVNVMLDEGSTYENIIEWLNQNGFPIVNKVNLHNWHKGGFQDWLREQERIENQSAHREWLGDIITQSPPGDLHHCIYTLFASQIMDSLFGIDTAKLKAGLAAKPRDYIALMNGFRRLDKELTDAPEFQKFLQRQRERKQGRSGLSPESAHAILRELRLDHLLARARECEEFRPEVKPG